MGILQNLKTKQMGIKSAENTSQGTSIEKQQQNQQTASSTQVQSKQPGTRLVSVMERMYKLIASADFDRNSCFIESSEANLGEVEIPRIGTYDSFLGYLVKNTFRDDKEAVAELYRRDRIVDYFLSGKSVISGIFKVAGELCEIRVERVVEPDQKSTRVRGCIFIRPVIDKEDNGHIERADRNDLKKVQLTEEQKLIKALFTGSYELIPDRNSMVGYECANGRFYKMDQRYAMREGIETWIKRGVISPKSADHYRNICRAGYLEKKTIEGQYIVEVLLRAPSEPSYHWYEEVIVPTGRNYRVYRRCIDTIVESQQEDMREEESDKLFAYSRTLLRTVASLVEFRNQENGVHIVRVNEITKILLEDIANRSPQYGLNKKKIRMYVEASTIHDIGKVTIPDDVLNKPGRLTPEEYELMKTHTVNGARILDSIGAEGQEELYSYCKDIALHHHERYDGKGYPEGLTGDQISIGAQAVGMADAYDALVSLRCYKDAYSKAKALEMISNGECGAFNPRLVESLKACLDKVDKIYAVK